MKTEYAWVIQRDDERYMYIYYVYEDENYGFGELNQAKLCDNIDEANEFARTLKNYYNIICKPVKVEIKVV